ncbi:DUF4062 domain-containing protein [Flavobacterium sp. 3HN19-14]|uniref:DUF4062 domain-containing protein n=1 Tax=Flavobacterium sp. 3HN19-14 TaxID=3448133 RepID=UPI003EE2B5D2
MPERKVYISSTFIDYADIRQKFIDLLNKDLYKWYGLNWIMESMRSNGDNTSPVQLCMDEVKRSDIYILIIGDRYGSETEVNGKMQSYTEHEFDAAMEANISTVFLIFAGDDFQSNYRDADVSKRQKLLDFKKRAQQKMLKARKFDSIDDVFDEFLSALYIDFHKRLIKEKIDLSPTIKYTINRNLQDELYLNFNNPQQRVRTVSRADVYFYENRR